MASIGSESRAAPVLPTKRYEVIDMVRGFALFGVLYINLLWTSRYIAGDSAPEGSFVSGSFDGVSFFLSEIFVNHKFYALFSILFGLGFAMQMASARDRGRRITPPYARRLAILVAIGLIHAFFVWPDDVLHIYALLGFALMLFRNCSYKILAKWIGVFFALSVVVTVLQWSMLNNETVPDNAPQEQVPDPLATPTDESGPFQLMSSGSYVDILRLNFGEIRRKYTSTEIGPGSMVFWYLTIFWKFLLGMYIGKKGTLQRSKENRHVFKRALPWAFGCALIGAVIMALGFGPLEKLVFSNPAALALFWLAVEAGMLGLSIFYLCVLVLWYQRPSGERVLSHLVPMGRMALTNYLMHSVIFLVIFYGVGFGMLGKITHAGAFPIAVAIFLAQIFISGWWLNRFRFGPMEWLWRSLTYARAQPLR